MTTDDLYEYKTSGNACFSEETRKALEEAGSESLHDLMPELAREMGLDEDMDVNTMMDMLRGTLQRCPVRAYVDHLHKIAGWVAADVTDRGTAMMGDYLFSFDVGGERIPAFLFSAITFPFDDTDPLQHTVVAKISKGVDRFLLMQPIPLFKFLHTATGSIERLIVHGGWLVEDGTPRAFLLSPRGPEDIPAHLPFFKGNTVSRGLYRDRGLPGDRIETLKEFVDILAKAKASLPGQEDIFETTGDYKLGTTPEGWSQLIDAGLFDMMESLNRTDWK